MPVRLASSFPIFSASPSPFSLSNSRPVRRLGPALARGGWIVPVWVERPDLSVRRMTRLPDPSGRRADLLVEVLDPA